MVQKKKRVLIGQRETEGSNLTMREKEREKENSH